MATDVARSIVNEARLQHRCEKSKAASASRGVLRLKSLKCDPREPTDDDDGYYDNDDVPEHMADDVYLSDYCLGKSSTGNIVLRGPGPAFEIANTQVIAQLLSRKFLQERQKAEENPSEPHEYGFVSMVDKEQLVYQQAYVQLLRDEHSAPLFSLQCELVVKDMVSQIEGLLQLYLAGNFIDGESDEAANFSGVQYWSSEGY